MLVRALDRFSVAGRVALVTGGNRGLGKAMARGLAEAGADVVIAARDEEALAAALPEILVGTGGRGGYVVADFNDRSAADVVAERALEQFGRIDIVVSNAGANEPEAIGAITDENWDMVHTVHLYTAMALTRALSPGMRERGWGRFVYVSSGLGYKGMERRSAYTSVKSALMGLARSAAIDLGPFGITVNCIAPGAFRTNALRHLTEAQRAQFEQVGALQRAADPDELVGPLLLLVSDAGSYISGSTLLVDGGWLIA